MPNDFSPPPAVSVDANEAERFAAQASEWRDPSGTSSALHRMNPVRLDFMLGHIAGQFGRNLGSSTPLAELTMLDLGCGGGLITEPLARLGARVTGIDPVAEMLDVARQHAMDQALQIRYLNTTAEELAATNEQFQIITCMEVVEHVADLPTLINAIKSLLAPHGILILSTLNRTAKSYLLAIFGAERVLRWVPPHTHDWRKFIRPAEMKRHLQDAGLQSVATTGFVYHPITGQWQTNESDHSVNYGMVAVHGPT